MLGDALQPTVKFSLHLHRPALPGRAMDRSCSPASRARFVLIDGFCVQGYNKGQ